VIVKVFQKYLLSITVKNCLAFDKKTKVQWSWSENTTPAPRALPRSQYQAQLCVLIWKFIVHILIMVQSINNWSMKNMKQLFYAICNLISALLIKDHFSINTLSTILKWWCTHFKNSVVHTAFFLKWTGLTCMYCVLVKNTVIRFSIFYSYISSPCFLPHAILFFCIPDQLVAR